MVGAFALTRSWLENRSERSKIPLRTRDVELKRLTSAVSANRDLEDGSIEVKRHRARREPPRTYNHQTAPMV